MPTDLVNNLIQELTCPICNELPIQPVRLKITEDNKQSICNDVFCETCIIQMFYHCQNSPDKNINDIKCPICAQKIFIENIENMKSISDCYVEDKISKKIIYQLLRQTPELIEYKCKYNCGFSGTNIKEIEGHYKADAQNCNTRIIKCPITNCPTLCKMGKEIHDHEKKCPYKYMTCPFCLSNVESNKKVFVNHVINYHKFKTVQFIQLAEELQSAEAAE